MKTRVMIGMLTMLASLGLSGAGRFASPVNLVESPCVNGLRPSTDGPFAALVSCEEALGSYLTVVYAGPMRTPKAGAWDIGTRTWHEPEWGDDVTSFVWGSKGKRLYVATSSVYGTGGVFQLELGDKRALKLFPAASTTDSEVVYVLSRLDESTQRLTVTARYAGGTARTFAIELEEHGRPSRPRP